MEPKLGGSEIEAERKLDDEYERKKMEIEIRNRANYSMCLLRERHLRLKGKERYIRFVKAMKKLGCEHHILRCSNTRKVTVDQVLEQVLAQGGSAPDPDNWYWTRTNVYKMLNNFRKGEYPREFGQFGFGNKIKAAVGVLGGGDLFHEAVITPEAVFELFDDETKALVPLGAVWYHLGMAREIFLRQIGPDLRPKDKPNWSLKRCCAEAPIDFLDQVPTHAPPSDSGSPPRKLGFFQRRLMADDLSKKHAQSCAPNRVKEEMETLSKKIEQQSEFMKELRELWAFDKKIKDDYYCMFLTALRRLGGEDDCDLPHVTPQALLGLIMEQVAASEFDDGLCNWTISRVEEELKRHRRGSFRPWTWRHHNAMLKAIADLGGDPFNEERVTPKAVLELMDHDAVVTNIHEAKLHLKDLRKALKKDPNNLVRYPWIDEMLDDLSFSSSAVEEVHALYSGGSAKTSYMEE